MVIRIKMEWFLFVFGSSVEKLVICHVSICAGWTSQKTLAGASGKEAGGLLLEQNSIHEFMWTHFRSRKGTTGKKNTVPRNGEVTHESSVPGQCSLGVWRAMWELKGIESCLLKRRCSQQFWCRPNHFSCCHNHRQVQEEHRCFLSSASKREKSSLHVVLRSA